MSLRSQRKADYDYIDNERRKRRRGGGYLLQSNILTIFTVLLAITISLVVYFAYYKNNNSVLDLTERFTLRVAESCVDRTIALFDPVADAVMSSAVLVEGDEAKTRNGSLFPFFMTVLNGNPQLQSIYIAFDADGRFLQAFPVPSNAQKFGANDAKPPDGSAFALRTIDRADGKYQDVWTYVAHDGTILGSETSNQLNYDPRPRPWYQDAIKKKALILSDLLVYTSNRQPGITAAFPIFAKDGRRIGVAAANVTTNQIADFLMHLDLGQSGLAVMVDENEQIIAYPDTSKTLHLDGLKLSLTKVTDLDDPRVRSAFQAYHETPNKVVRFQAKDEDYLATFIPFPEEFGKKWQMVAIVLENDFVGTFKKNTRDIIGFSLLFLLVSMWSVSILSKWISSPLKVLSKEIQKIQKFELDDPIDMYSFIVEVNELINSLNIMKRALHTFGMFVPRELVRELVASGKPIELGGQDRSLTVMFTDIADFTALSERMPPGELLVHVSRHLSAMSRCIIEEHGTVDKYVGDAVMAFWGAPNALEDHALRGCVGALKAKHAQDAMNDEWKRNNLPTLFVRIGLHTSHVIVGNIGSVQRMSYTAVGDGVNVASRLEGVNKVYGTQICVSQAVVAAAGESLVVRPLDKVAVKGRTTGEMIYELLALKSGPAELLPTPAQMEICRLTEQAFEAYLSQNWQLAIERYQLLAEATPDEKLPGIFVERCRRYLTDPPQNWTGIYKLLSK